MSTRGTLFLDGAYIFSQIDTIGLNYISSRGFQEWLSEIVGFKLSEVESKLIMSRYDKKGSHTINLGEFIEEISPPPQEEEDNMEDFEGEAVDETDEQRIEGRQARLEMGYDGEEGADEERQVVDPDQEDEDDDDEESESNMRRRYLSGGEDEELKGETRANNEEENVAPIENNEEDSQLQHQQQDEEDDDDHKYLGEFDDESPQQLPEDEEEEEEGM